MASTFDHLVQRGLLPGAPRFLASCVQYEVVMGSIAYGVSTDQSDMDVYGFAIPPKEDVFPHLRGEIPGFDRCEPTFEQFQRHHIQDPSALGGKGREYDITIYSITKYFKLLMDNNPNIIDSLFVPQHCILHSTPVANRIREKRQLFLHKGCWAKFKGYAYSQVHKMDTKVPEGKRKAIIEAYGYDVKFAYHVVRLLNEVEQLLTEQDLDLTRHKEQLKAIRRGEWTLNEVKEYFNAKEKTLERRYEQSSLPPTPDVDKIRNLLLECLEHHYGNLSAVVPRRNAADQTLNAIKHLVDDYMLQQGK
ncbi:nucleotidyltransferase [Oleiphilus messinensis]|uniref:Nucleotidyltransferase n=1 Tax=Oleiphilus messinensis TaxID=141451 RepID=A0A1Y0I1B4_9GAMM|nr:nucleotidyltransferase domain-containing protein [Oleiphilus messinensis]ARU54247.1 nucleotidyltransferase [Oleiphilus messinensis]